MEVKTLWKSPSLRMPGPAPRGRKERGRGSPVNLLLPLRWGRGCSLSNQVARCCLTYLRLAKCCFPCLTQTKPCLPHLGLAGCRCLPRLDAAICLVSCWVGWVPPSASPHTGLSWAKHAVCLTPLGQMPPSAPCPHLPYIHGTGPAELLSSSCHMGLGQDCMQATLLFTVELNSPLYFNCF